MQGQSETVELEVSKETIINGMKLNDKPGVDRSVVFTHARDGHNSGRLQDVSGLYWDVKEWEDAAIEHWEANIRHGLKETIEVPNHESGKTVYKVNYTEE